ncbi:hypothetical protein AB0J37_35530, partial [Microbispora rosea]
MIDTTQPTGAHERPPSPLPLPLGGTGERRHLRPAGGRLRRRLLAAFVAAALALPVTGAARPEAVAAPVPPRLPPLRAVTAASLAERYAATRGAIEAAMRTAAAAGHRWRAAMLRAMAGPARSFLSFDGRDGGRVAHVSRRTDTDVGTDTGTDPGLFPFPA